MNEKQIEAKLRDAIKAMGGIAYKFTSPGNLGVPDRIILLPGGRVWFVELKTDTGRMTATQERQAHRIRQTGGNVCTLYGIDQVNAFLAERRMELDDDE